jgi:hypothetical protein
MKEPALNKAYGKVSGKLEDYSHHRGIEPTALRLLDVCDDMGDIHPKLYKYIDQLPRGSKQTEENYRDYKEQIRSIIRRVISAVLHPISARLGDQNSSLIAAEAPEFIKPILTLLPRRRGSYPCNGPGWRETRERAPISDGGQAILLALIEVAGRFEVDDLKLLIDKHSSDIRQAMKTTARPPEQKGAEGYCADFLRAARAKYEIPCVLGRKKSVYLDQLPPMLKSEVNNFMDRAPHGISSYPDLLACAALYAGNIDPFEASTIRTYYEGLLNGFGCISLTFEIEDLSVRDLLMLEEVERDFGGRVRKVKANRYVEAYRVQEMGMASDRKRKGFDSSNFARFISALKAIAAFNNIFDLQEEFTEAYSVRLDKHMRGRNKDKKKKRFKLAALDQVISEMRPRFMAIMNERSYEFRGPLPKAVREKINFCLFYVVLVTLRYLGYRQMQVRDCIYGVNIIFAKDGSITLRWNEEQVKNDREIIHPLSARAHKKSYGIALETLNSYHERLYKFALSRNADKINRQFFLHLNNQGQFVSFAASTSTLPSATFYKWFNRCAQKHLRHLEELYPHFLRGLCADWLKNLKIGIEKTSDALGDSVLTVSRDYLDRKAPYNGKATFDAVEAVIESHELQEKGAVKATEVETIKQLYAERDAMKDSQLKEAKAEIKRLRKELGESRRGRIKD